MDARGLESVMPTPGAEGVRRAIQKREGKCCRIY